MGTGARNGKSRRGDGHVPASNQPIAFQSLAQRLGGPEVRDLERELELGRSSSHERMAHAAKDVVARCADQGQESALATDARTVVLVTRGTVQRPCGVYQSSATCGRLLQRFRHANGEVARVASASSPARGRGLPPGPGRLRLRLRSGHQVGPPVASVQRRIWDRVRFPRIVEVLLMLPRARGRRCSRR